ncbi:HSP90 [Symbiodinium microadriaticum]|nr:HSP90 [Symbiodinium microadriaticum]
MQCSRMKPDERPTAQQLLDHSWLEETDGNRLCELLPPEEAPDDVPDVDIFPKAAVAWTHHPGKKSTDAFHSLTSSHGEPLCQLQPQLPQIMEEDEDLQDGAALPLSQHPHSAVARFPFDVECAEWFSVSRPN